jgi:hypothetical protein
MEAAGGERQTGDGKRPIPWKRVAEPLVLLVLVAAGVWYRLAFAATFPEPLIYDQWGYDGFARMILEKGLYAISSRTYGYPLIVAVIYKLFGPDNAAAWRTVQAGMDAATAFFAYLIVRQLTRSKPAAWTALAIALVNPLTAAYVGVLMTEVPSALLFTGTFLLTVLGLRYRRFGAIAGSAFLWSFLTQVRPAFFLWGVAATLATVLAAVWWCRMRATVGRGIVMILMAALPFVYAVAGNIIYYRQFSLTTVDNLSGGMLFLSVVYPRGMWDGGILPDTAAVVTYMDGEYDARPTNAAERAQMSKKYFDMAMDLIKKDPGAFWRARFMKTVWIWEKRYLFYYRTTPPSAVPYLVWGNRIFLLLSAWGFMAWIFRTVRGKRPGWELASGILAAAAVIYLSVIHMLATTEDRYTLPVYPLLSVFCGMGIVAIAGFVRRRSGSGGTDSHTV